jgi:predicted RNA-binding Zn ribbon-like protein
LRRVFHEIAGGGLSEPACGEINEWLSASLARLGVEPVPRSGRGSVAARWRWRGATAALDSPLWPIAWSAARLVISDESPRLRVCAGPDCGWVYVDRSRNGLRHWCQMKSCGTAAKTLRRRARRRE